MISDDLMKFKISTFHKSLIILEIIPENCVLKQKKVKIYESNNKKKYIDVIDMIYKHHIFYIQTKFN